MSFLDSLKTATGIASGVAGIAQGQQSNKADWGGAKHGISWKVADAKAAGIHPLYALGATPAIPGMPSGGSGASEGLQQIAGTLGEESQRRTQAGITKGDTAMRVSQHAANLGHTQASTDYIGWQSKLIQQKIMEGRLNQTGIGRAMDPPGPEYSGVKMGSGKPWLHDPRVSDTAVSSERIGELADFTVGPYVAYADWRYNSPYYQRLKERARKMAPQDTPYWAYGGP